MSNTLKNNKLRRPITVTDLYRKKFNLLPFTGEWLNTLGRPERTGSWIIYGDSTNGKTRFTLQMAKYLAQFGIVYINSLEEGQSESIKQGFRAVGIEKGDKVYLLDREPLSTVKFHLDKQRSAPDFVFFDSIQFMRGFTKEQYFDLLKEYRNTIFIFTSHAEGKHPRGALATDIYYASFIKMRVEGYRVFPKSRYGGNQSYDIWPEMAEAYWAEKK